MEVYTQSLNRLIEEFAKLPGVGKKTAERLAYHILMAPEPEALGLATAVRDVKANVRHCEQCFNLSESGLCAICSDTRRDTGILCVVEQPKDVIALEKTGVYRGLYHVLMGHVNPLEGMHPQDLTIDPLLARARQDSIREILIATNPDLEGDGTAALLHEQLAPLGKRVTRIAKGIPVGSAIEYASKAILQDALTGRREM